jgi:hypothetical protein
MITALPGGVDRDCAKAAEARVLRDVLVVDARVLGIHQGGEGEVRGVGDLVETAAGAPLNRAAHGAFGGSRS